MRTGFGGGISQAYAAALQADGKLVIAGTSGTDTSAANFTIVRLDTNNVLDVSFGDGGRVVTSTTSGSAPYVYGAPAAVKVQADGKIVAGGYGFNGTNYTDFLLVRYNPDGSIDTSFGGTGKVYTDFGSRSQISGMVIQADGKIVAVGWIGSDSEPTHFALARYQTNGAA